MKGVSVVIYLIHGVIGIAQTILGLRIVLKLFGASTNAPFVQWIYKTSQPLLHPFEGIFPTKVLDGNFIIEFSSLFALLMYSLIGYFLTRIVLTVDNKVGR
ncbi:YggT family protein [Salirhabdus salicampi]|uniref:YggT family protein n=1 Tax=Salirhabdus salicampi TaxID=476102 RepID=UPI0020C20FB7|nr:YggT family protein [Salirhabdus salicampi]MCP8615451.1 YggT family protein [Salirhabdus salicampi]